jgi:hypothetical protein
MGQGFTMDAIDGSNSSASSGSTMVDSIPRTNMKGKTATGHPKDVNSTD